MDLRKKRHRILNFVKKITRFFDLIKVKRLKWKLNLPFHPDAISALSVILSLLIFYNAVLCLAIVLFLDLIGGAIARARKIASYKGQLIDWSSDRFSEFIIFGYYALSNPIWLILPIVNTMINMLVISDIRIRGIKLYVLPLRQVLLAMLIGFLIIRYF